MLLSPIQNCAIFNQTWVQTKPVVTQQFGLNPQMYSKFNLMGHPGIDFRAYPGTPIFAPMDGIVEVLDTGNSGYGLHVRIRNSFKELEIVLGHLSNHCVKAGQKVMMGDPIGESGNSGFSTAPHLHMGARKLILSEDSLYAWQVLNVDNGYAGYFDFLDNLVCFKGSLLNNNL